MFAWLAANDDPGLSIYEPPFEGFQKALAPINNRAVREANALRHHWMGVEHLAIAFARTRAGGHNASWVLCHPEVGGEHLLLAMLGDGENMASDILRQASHNLTSTSAAASVERQLWVEAGTGQRSLLS